MEEPRWHLTPSEAAGINSSLVNEVADLRARVAELESRERRLREACVMAKMWMEFPMKGRRDEVYDGLCAALADAPADAAKPEPGPATRAILEWALEARDVGSLGFSPKLRDFLAEWGWPRSETPG